MGPLNNEADEQNIAFPKQLAVLHMHLQPVNSVRWSNDGKYLASCGDDASVMLCRCVAGGELSGNLGDEPNQENWRVVTQGIGHNSNVQDIAWSPDGTKLASCSTDNTVIIWDVPKLSMCIFS
jgi:protein HIRA/HIR1